MSSVYFVTALDTLRRSALPGFKLPVLARAALVLVLLCLITRHALVFEGVVRVGESPEQSMSNLIGERLSQLAPTIGVPKPGLLYVVTEENCGSCDLAKRQLPTLDIPWRELPISTIVRKEGCFDAGNLNFATPMLLACDANGRVIFQQDGWVSSDSDLLTLKTQIQNAMRKGTQ